MLLGFFISILCERERASHGIRKWGRLLQQQAEHHTIREYYCTGGMPVMSPLAVWATDTVVTSVLTQALIHSKWHIICSSGDDLRGARRGHSS